MIKIQWLPSIWRQNDQTCWVTSQNIQNKAKLQKWSKSNDLNRFDARTFKTKQNYKTDQITMNCIDWMSKLSKQLKTKLNYKSDQNPMTCIDLTSKRSKMLSYVAKHAKLQNRSNYNKLHRLDVKTIKTKLNYKSDQNPMTCIDLTSKRSKCWVTSQNIQNNAKLQKQNPNLHHLNCIDWMSKHQNKAKLQKWSKSNDLHRFDVKTFKTKQIYKMIKLQWIASIRKNDSKQS